MAPEYLCLAEAVDYLHRLIDRFIAQVTLALHSQREFPPRKLFVCGAFEDVVHIHLLPKVSVFLKVATITKGI